MSDDGALLRDYAHSGSEAALAQLVERHLDFVYSTALRVVRGDEFLAEDVSQSAVIATAALTPIVIQYQANARLKGEIEGLRSQLTERARPRPAEQRSIDRTGLERLRVEHSGAIYHVMSHGDRRKDLLHERSGQAGPGGAVWAGRPYWR